MWSPDSRPKTASTADSLVERGLELMALTPDTPAVKAQAAGILLVTFGGLWVIGGLIASSTVEPMSALMLIVGVALIWCRHLYVSRS